jgi:cell division protein FtsQ
MFRYTKRGGHAMKARDAMLMSDETPMALDIRLMNITSVLLMLVFGLVLVSALLWWIVRHPVFALTAISVQGDVRHNNAVTLRANVVPRLRGGFFTVDLMQARATFENVPWVRQALVRREFPNRLSVELEEHQPAAFWGNDADSRLLNKQGEVFSANFGELDDENLPRLSGPDSESAQVLQMYEVLKPELGKLQFQIKGLELTARGSWRAELKSGAQIELGRGNSDEVLARVERMTLTLAQVTQRYGRQTQALEAADLRHVNGYALRLRGVSTLTSTSTTTR